MTFIYIMANEAKLVQKLQDRLSQVIVADGTGIEKGTLLQLTDANIGSASSADGEIPVGIAASEKVADDGSTTLAIYTYGIFDMKCDGVGVTAGDPVKIGGANLISLADDATAAGLKEVIGYARQTGAASEVIEVEVRL